MKRPVETDSEGDEDYVPPVNENEGSGSESEDSSGDESNRAQRASREELNEKKDLGKVWEEFQATVASQPRETRSQDVKLVKVVRKYRFAGEEHEELVEVPENSEDARKWPQYQATNTPISSTSDSMAPASEGSLPYTSTRSAVNSKATSSTVSVQPTVTIAPTTTSTSRPSTSQPPPPKRKPGPRKPKTTLAPFPSAASNPKKITTLEKSAMDWSKHVTPDDKDELEALRRGGDGYLDKVEFLNRVEERKESVLSEASASKRRRL